MYIKKIKKAITLMELVVTISVSSIIFIGVSGLLIFLHSTNSSLRVDAQNFYNTNTLLHAVENILDDGNHNLFNLPSEDSSFMEDKIDDLPGVPADAKKLFSVIKKDENITYHYYFYHQHFGYTSGNSLVFNNIYTSESKVRLDVTVPQTGNCYKFAIYYGSEFNGVISLEKILFKGEQ